MRSRVIEIYSSIECPYAYLATYRLRQLADELTGQARLVWRALSLEYINRQVYPKPLHDFERTLFEKIEPHLPWKKWEQPDWQWPSTFWPASEALACAQAQGDEPAAEMSWALRYAFFAENRNIALRHEIIDIAEQVAKIAPLNLIRFLSDWDHGVYKSQVLRESRRGWHELRLNGSATFVLQDGERHTNPALGEIDFDEENIVLNGYRPFAGDPLDEYRRLLLLD